MTTLTDQLVGASQRGSAVYTMVYRSFDHRRMKTVCRAIDTDRLPAKYAASLRCTAVDQPWRNFAAIFVALQDQRHAADYDPGMEINIDIAMRWCLSARYARRILAEASTGAVSPVLALMAFGVRD